MIPFTQYLPPHGHKRHIEIDLAPEIERLADEFIDSGGYFECEELSTGHVSLTACHSDEDEGDIAIEVVMNGPGISEAVERLVTKAHAWLRRAER